MKSKKLQDKLRLHFPFTPTTEQDERITDIADFVSAIGNRSIFMLKGYAGTGKTGDIQFTTVDKSAGDTYSVTLYCIKEY